ncbi:hypothetical protein EST38_g9760 [Candolleomyces aberdarensis]|uniref:Ricin B lectin domain-containing protein n=1 Tax=Candolleomyces aberdarensis TaxID=2316362 RepID=A0A4Q2D944_9AGAR|nr:hypothetical protein EST38_g9760 [Candolleomyces aberdarensis]
MLQPSSLDSEPKISKAPLARPPKLMVPERYRLARLAEKAANATSTAEPEPKISVGAADNKDAHVASASPSAGDHLKGAGGGVGSIYTAHPQPDGSFKLSIPSSNNTDLFWTLDSEAEGTKITLMPDNSSSNQLWALEEVGDN